MSSHCDSINIEHFDRMQFFKTMKPHENWYFFYFQKRATYHLAQQKPVFRKFKLKKVFAKVRSMSWYEKFVLAYFENR